MKKKKKQKKTQQQQSRRLTNKTHTHWHTHTQLSRRGICICEVENLPGFISPTNLANRYISSPAIVVVVVALSLSPIVSAGLI